MSPEDKAVLVRLAERVARIAAGSRMTEVRQLWHRINTLQKTRPAVFCDPENGWNEIVTEAQMECRGKLARRWEMDLRKEIFWGEEMGDDKPVEPLFDVPYTVSPGRLGLAAGLPQDRDARLLRLGRPDPRLQDRPEEAPRPAVRDRLGDHPRLRSQSPRTSSAASSPCGSRAPGGGRWG